MSAGCSPLVQREAKCNRIQWTVLLCATLIEIRVFRSLIWLTHNMEILPLPNGVRTVLSNRNSAAAAQNVSIAHSPSEHYATALMTGWVEEDLRTCLTSRLQWKSSELRSVLFSVKNQK
eukprot:IDg5319t1